MQQLPLANIVTLGVTDFELERDFYRRLGWPLALDTDDFAVFETARCPSCPIRHQGRGSGRPCRAGAGDAGGIRSSIIITVDQPEEVDELIERAGAAGARVTKEPVAAEYFEGRDAYFADPEGHFWEVARTSGRPGCRCRPARRRRVTVYPLRASCALDDVAS